MLKCQGTHTTFIIDKLKFLLLGYASQG